MINYTVTQIWLLATIFFVIFEMGTPGLFYSLSFAFGALTAAMGAWNGFSVFLQWTMFFCGAICSLLMLKAWVTSVTFANKEVSNIDALIGKQGIVVKEVSNVQCARVKVGSEYWFAQSEDAHSLKNGMQVTIINVTGTKLIVKINK